MRTIGIVAEFNPYTNGHEYLIKEARRIVNDNRAVVITVMSGPFTQRGLPALLPKEARTQACLVTSKEKKTEEVQGADLVLELPFVYACAPASEFARGAVKTLTSTGVLTDLAFGIDIENPELIIKLASVWPQIESSPEFSEALKAYISEGSSYPSASAQATLKVIRNSEELSSLYTEAEYSELPEALRNPNSILALEYIKEINIYNSAHKAHPIMLHMIPRIGNGYNSEDLTVYASASAIRNSICENPQNSESVASLIRNLCGYLPDKTLAGLASDISMHKYHLINYSEYIRDSYDLIISLSSDELSQYTYMGDELSSYLKNLCNTKFVDNNLILKNWEHTVATRHFTLGRIWRALASLRLNRKADAHLGDAEPRYIRVLGFNSDGRYCLKVMSKCAKLPIIHNLSDFKSQSAEVNEMAEYDIRANNLQGKYLGMPLNREWEETPIIVK